VDYEPSCCESVIERLLPWIEKLVENQMIFVKIREIGLDQFLVNLAQLVRFIVVKLTHPGSNHKFDMCVAFTANYSLGDDVPVDSETLLMTDFVNLKIKPLQSFGGAHKNMVCIRVFIGVSARTCTSIYICTVFFKILNFSKNLKNLK
jgi:hypothetical protein